MAEGDGDGERLEGGKLKQGPALLTIPYYLILYHTTPKQKRTSINSSFSLSTLSTGQSSCPHLSYRKTITPNWTPQSILSTESGQVDMSWTRLVSWTKLDKWTVHRTGHYFIGVLSTCPPQKKNPSVGAGFTSTKNSLPSATALCIVLVEV